MRSDRCSSLAETVTIPYEFLQYLFPLPWWLRVTGALDGIATRWQSPSPGSLNCCVEKSPCLPQGATCMVCHLRLTSSPATLTLSSVLEDATPYLDLKSSCMSCSGNPRFLCLNCHSYPSLDLLSWFFLQILTEIALSGGNFLTHSNCLRTIPVCFHDILYLSFKALCNTTVIKCATF